MTDVNHSDKIHPCYWPGCGGDTYIMRGSPTRTWVSCNKCDASGPVCERERPAVEAWNSLASCLKSAPKVVTIKRWATVFLDGDDKYVSTGLFEEEVHARTFCDRRTYIDTVEVSITFTDSRGGV